MKIRLIFYWLMLGITSLQAQYINRPVLGETDVRSIGITDGLIIWWPFNEGNICTGCGTNSFSVFNIMPLDARIDNAATSLFIITERGIVVSPTGGGGSWITPNVVQHNIGTGDFTWMCWAYPTSLAAYEAMISNGTFAPGFYAALGGGNFGFYSGGNLPSGTNAVANTWQHFVAERTGTILKFYYNGIQTPTTQTFATSIDNAVIRVGEDGGGDPFDGYMYDVRIYSRALGADEIMNVYLDNLNPRFTFNVQASGRRRWIVQSMMPVQFFFWLLIVLVALGVWRHFFAERWAWNKYFDHLKLKSRGGREMNQNGFPTHGSS